MGNSAPRVSSSAGVYQPAPKFSESSWTSLEEALGRSINEQKNARISST